MNTKKCANFFAISACSQQHNDTQKNVAAMNNLKYVDVLTLHFQMQQLTCEVHLIVARAMGPKEALAEQYFAPCLLLCQPPERIRTKIENMINGIVGNICQD